jgi:hypothetical protein
MQNLNKPCFKGAPRDVLLRHQYSGSAVVARDIYMALRAKGWDAVLAEYSSAAAKAPGPATTVGDYCARARATYRGRSRTRDDYIRSFRRIVADIYAVERGPEKYDYATGGRDQWLARVDTIRLSDLSRA